MPRSVEDRLDALERRMYQVEDFLGVAPPLVMPLPREDPNPNQAPVGWGDPSLDGTGTGVEEPREYSGGLRPDDVAALNDFIKANVADIEPDAPPPLTRYPHPLAPGVVMKVCKSCGQPR